MSKLGIDRRHCKWPLGIAVWTLTPNGYLMGWVNRHSDRPDGCDVEFAVPVDLGDANGERYCHHIPFRKLRRDDPKAPRPAAPWYRELRQSLKADNRDSSGLANGVTA